MILTEKRTISIKKIQETESFKRTKYKVFLIGIEQKGGVFMANKGPKTLRGWERKLMTGDGRKSTPMEKAIKETNRAMEEAIYGKRKKRGGKKK